LQLIEQTVSNSMSQKDIGPGSLDIGGFVTRLLEALRRGGQSQAALAAVMYYSKSLLTKVIKGDSTPDERFFRIYFERGVPFLIAFGGVTDADQVRAMAKAAGVRLTEGELRVAAQGARDPDFLAEARRPGSAADNDLTSADLRLTHEYAKARAEAFEQSIQPPAEPARPALTPAHPEPDPTRWLETVNLLAARHCGRTPAVFGRQMHIAETNNRLVWLAGDSHPILAHHIFEALDGRSALLAGVPGSGRTTLLRQLGYQLMVSWEPGRPQPVYLSAPEVLKQAGRRRSVVELVAEQVVVAGGAEASKIKVVTAALDDLDRDHQLVWLVDDVDRLSDAEQVDLAAHFVVSHAVFAVSPAQAMDGQGRFSVGAAPMLLSVSDLEPDEQDQMLQCFFLAWSENTPSLPARRAVLDTVSAMAKLPIGLAAVHSQMETGRVTPARIVETAVREYLVRAGLDFPTDWTYWPGLPPPARGLAVLAETMLSDLAWYGAASEDYGTPQARFDVAMEEPYRSDWHALASTRQCLVTETNGRPVARFFNDDLWCYWASRRIGSITGYGWQEPSERTRWLVDRVNAFRDERRARA